jgi:monofunctional biosynthetic peptidoglycan transglycosylase
MMVLMYRWLNPPMTTVMLEKWWQSEHSSYDIRQTWLDWDALPANVALAVVTSEDQNFLNHHGVDLNAIYRAIKASAEGNNLRGASTITQQVAKNLYLWTGRSWIRKGLELWFSLLIEVLWPKQRILEMYLNIAEWGEGVFGIEAASYYYFGRSSAQLTDYQAALLACALPSPLRFNPGSPSSYLKSRAHWNLQQQSKLGGTTWLAPLYADR